VARNRFRGSSLTFISPVTHVDSVLTILQSFAPQTSPSKAPPPPTAPKTEDGVLKFTDVVNNLQNVYPRQAMADISTSYCFICLLHLANEKGLVISNEEGFQELNIRRDHSADITGDEA